MLLFGDSLVVELVPARVCVLTEISPVVSRIGH